MIHISISDQARAMLRKTGTQEHKILRITVKSGGCAGMTYDAEIDTEVKENESVIYRETDLRVVADESSLPFLEGLEIDYSDDLISAGFRFNNSTNDSSCGCGASFSLSGFPALNKGGITCDL